MAYFLVRSLHSVLPHRAAEIWKWGLMAAGALAAATTICLGG